MDEIAKSVFLGREESHPGSGQKPDGGYGRVYAGQVKDCYRELTHVHVHGNMGIC